MSPISLTPPMASVRPAKGAKPPEDYSIFSCKKIVARGVLLAYRQRSFSGP